MLDEMQLVIFTSEFSSSSLRPCRPSACWSKSEADFR